MNTDRMLTSQEAADEVALSLPAFWRAVASGRLPAPLYPAPKAPRWRLSEIHAALEATRMKPSEAMNQRRLARIKEAHNASSN